MTKPLTNRQITNRWVKLLIDKMPDISVPELVHDQMTLLRNTRPTLPAKDRHSIIINTITRYVRYLLEQEDKLNAS